MNVELDNPTRQAVSAVGEMMIVAAAVIGTLTPKQQDELRLATNGAFPDSILMALRAARDISPHTKRSLRDHPPVGFVGLELEGV